jgi:hypothetical protein
MGIFDIFKREKKTAPIIHFTSITEKKGSFILFEKKLLRKSLILLVVGKRGSGKTALGMTFLEFFHEKTKKKTYVLGYDDVKLPSWVKKAEEIDKVPVNSCVLIDEGALAFSARDSMKDANKTVGRIMAIARHKNLTLIFVSQNSAMIDVNVLRLVDTILLKEPSLLQAKFERKALREIYEDVHDSFEHVENKMAHVFIYDDDYQGMISYALPTFWKEDISVSFKNK